MIGGEPTLYELLDLEETADEHDIARAFRRLAKRWHPDLNPTGEATERMQRISAAYETLRDPQRRAAYDRSLRTTRTAPRASTSAGSSPARTESWWQPQPGGPIARVVAAQGPPPACRATSRTPLVWAPWRTTPRPGAGQSTVGSARGLVIACMTICPFLAFLSAAGRGGGHRLARWGALYLAAPPLVALGLLTAGSMLELAGRSLWLIGVLHVISWRHRLLQRAELDRSRR